jgi:PmbA protein
MIAPLIERAARRATEADAVLKTDETTTLEYAAGSPVSATSATSQGVNLRVVVEGRAGFAGSVDGDADELLDRAMASASIGELTVISLPEHAPMPGVVTHVPRAAAASVPELAGLCHLVRDRLGAERADLALTLERSLGSVRVANTRGVDACYDVSEVTLAVCASRLLDGRRIVIEGRLAGADLPRLTELEQLVAMLRQRLAWAERPADLAAGRQRVAFLPAALPALLGPVEQALAGKTMQGGPGLATRGVRAFSEQISLTDDPLADGRPGSRPIDDEGVVSRPLVLVKAGVVEAQIFDLETASRVGATPTGHGRRSTFGKPQPACSNLILETGSASWEDILVAVGDGLLVERLWSRGQSNVVGGTFASPASLAWRVHNGEITGLAPEMTIAGNAHDLLNRVVAVGRDAVWVGSRAAPPIVVDGVSVF